MFRLLIIVGIPVLMLVGLHLLSLGIWSRTESNFQAQGTFIDVAGARLHYVEEGEGRPIVLMHGSMLNARDMEMSLMPALSSEYRVIAFDRPGLGHSTRPEGLHLEDPREQAQLIHIALGEMGVAQPVLVAHSWSAAVALAYVLEFPQDVKGVVLLSGATHPSEERITIYDVARMPVGGGLARQTFLPPLVLGSMGAVMERFFGPNEPPENYIDRSGLALVLDPDRMLSDARDFSAIGPALADMRQGYRSIRTPMTIITGDQDNAISSEENSYRLHAEVIGSELIVLEGVGHMPHHAATDEVAAAIAALAER